MATEAYKEYKGCYLIQKSDKEYILYVPKHLSKAPYNLFDDHEYKGADIIVAGGNNLVTLENMFVGCMAKSIDLRYLFIPFVMDTTRMFEDCEAEYIDLSAFDTSKVYHMGEMFCGCQAKSLDLRSFDTSKVKYMTSMFMRCKARQIDLSSFNTSNVESMNDMFGLCDARVKTKDREIKKELKARYAT